MSQGGGMYSSNSNHTVSNCVFTANTALIGGAMYNTQSSPKIINCVFYFNSAINSGGGIYNSLSAPIIKNCILWENVPDQIVDSASTPNVSHCDIQGGYPGANINKDPMFVDPSAHDFHLQIGSPCIDTGYNPSASILDIDYEGEPRFVDGDGDTVETVDIGADEFFYPVHNIDRNTYYHSIQDAVDDANNNDTIECYGKTYYENVEVYKPLTIRNKNFISFPTVHASDRYVSCFTVTSDYVTISHFTVEHAIGASCSGIFILGVEYCNVEYNVAIDNFYGIYLGETDYNYIYDNEIYNNRYGIYLYAAYHNELTLNEIYDNHRQGIYLSISTNNLIVTNTVYNNNGDGIALDYSGYNDILGNILSFNHIGIYLGHSNAII